MREKGQIAFFRLNTTEQGGGSEVSSRTTCYEEKDVSPGANLPAWI